MGAGGVGATLQSHTPCTVDTTLCRGVWKPPILPQNHSQTPVRTGFSLKSHGPDSLLLYCSLATTNPFKHTDSKHSIPHFYINSPLNPAGFRPASLKYRSEKTQARSQKYARVLPVHSQYHFCEYNSISPVRPGAESFEWRAIQRNRHSS
jgi:hypothetical protein